MAAYLLCDLGNVTPPPAGPQLPSLKHGMKAIPSFLAKVRVLAFDIQKIGHSESDIQKIVISSASGPEPVQVLGTQR